MTDARSLMCELHAIRVSRGILQATVARRMGVSRPAVSRLEHDTGRDPHLSTVLRYASAVGVRLVVEGAPKTVDKQVKSGAAQPPEEQR